MINDDGGVYGSLWNRFLVYVITLIVVVSLAVIADLVFGIPKEAIALGMVILVAVFIVFLPPILRRERR